MTSRVIRYGRLQRRHGVSYNVTTVTCNVCGIGYQKRNRTLYCPHNHVAVETFGPEIIEAFPALLDHEWNASSAVAISEKIAEMMVKKCDEQYLDLTERWGTALRKHRAMRYHRPSPETVAESTTALATLWLEWKAAQRLLLLARNNLEIVKNKGALVPKSSSVLSDA